MLAELKGDCGRCAGLCCVAPAFATSADFAVDKPAGTACPNLAADDRCRIHARLRPEGFAGCAAYDCLGAGQQVTQVTFGGRTWRDGPEIAQHMFEVFAVMRELHAHLRHLCEALTFDRAGPLRAEVRAAVDEVRGLTSQDPDTLLGVDRAALGRRVGALLRRVSDLVRGQSRHGLDFAGKDLTGRDLAGRDLRGALFVGTRLLGADLRGADLRRADLRWADLRAADLGGADLSDCLFLVQPQVEACRGDERTRLPALLERPAHWRGAPGAASVRPRAGGKS